MKFLEKLLNDNKVSGLKITYAHKFFILLLMLAYAAISVSNIASTIIYGILILLSVFATIFLFFKFNLIKNKNLLILFTIVIDFLILILIMIAWYFNINTPLAYDSFLVIITLYLIIININTFEPIIPLITSIIGFLLHSIILILALLYNYAFISFKFSGAEFILTKYFLVKLVVILNSGILLYYIMKKFIKMMSITSDNHTKKAQLGRFFSPFVTDIILKKTDKFYKYGGKEKNAALLIGNMQGFSAFLETYNSDILLEIISKFKNIFTESIFNNRGTINNIYQDNVIASFGAPNTSKKDILNAVNCAWEVNEKIEELNSKLYNKSIIPIKLAICIHYGPLITGNIGDEETLEYIVTGDTINITQKILSVCQASNKSILISQAVKDDIQDFYYCENIDKIHVNDETIELFHIVDKN